MSSSYTSSWSRFFVYSTTRMVTGSTTISYNVFSVTCEIINDGISSQGMTPPNANGKKMIESVVSPNTVLQMARAEKFVRYAPLSLAEIFIFDIT